MGYRDGMEKMVKIIEQVGGPKLSPREIGKEEARLQRSFRNLGLKLLHEERLLNSAGVREFELLWDGPLSTRQRARGADLPLFVKADRCAGGTA